MPRESNLCRFQAGLGEDRGDSVAVFLRGWIVPVGGATPDRHKVGGQPPIGTRSEDNPRPAQGREGNPRPAQGRGQPPIGSSRADSEIRSAIKIRYNFSMPTSQKNVLLTGGFLMDDVRARLESGFAVRVLPNSESECDAFLARHGGRV